MVFHRENKWDFEKGRLEIDQLWKDFNVAFIGYKPNCSVIRYKHDSGAFVTEYMFPMIFLTSTIFIRLNFMVNMLTVTESTLLPVTWSECSAVTWTTFLPVSQQTCSPLRV